MNTRYVILLLTIFLLASCGNKESATNDEVTNELPQVEAPAALVEQNAAIDDSTILDPEEEAQKLLDSLEDDDNSDISPEEVPEDIATVEVIIPETEEEVVEEESKQEDEEVEAEDIPAPTEEEIIPTDPNPEDTDSQTKVIELNQTYTSPGGEEEVKFTISTNNGVIESVSTLEIEASSVGKKRIAAFAGNINAIVSGKTLEEAENIVIVGGSSLTTGAFTQALKDM